MFSAARREICFIGCFVLCTAWEKRCVLDRMPFLYLQLRGRLPTVNCWPGSFKWSHRIRDLWTKRTICTTRRSLLWPWGIYANFSVSFYSLTFIYLYLCHGHHQQNHKLILLIISGTFCVFFESICCLKVCKSYRRTVIWCFPKFWQLCTLS